jgi:hypothetical protein
LMPTAASIMTTITMDIIISLTFKVIYFAFSFWPFS